MWISARHASLAFSTPRPAGTFGAARQKAPAGAYSNLFKAQDLLKTALEQQRPAAEKAKRRVVCGMTIIEADPATDPRMVAEAPKSSGIEYKIRAMDPPICNPAK